MRSTNCHSCIPLDGKRQKRTNAVFRYLTKLPPILQRFRACRCRLRFDCVVARDSGYSTIAFMSDAVDGRSAARCRNTIVRQNVTFGQI